MPHNPFTSVLETIPDLAERTALERPSPIDYGVMGPGVEALLAAGIVALFYWFRFNTMRGTRSYTTAALYYTGASCFILPFVGLYALVVLLIATAVPSILLPAVPAIYVLMLIWLLPIFPKAWRSVCHKMAAIPAYAYRFKEVLAAAPFALRPVDEPAVRRMLVMCGYDFDDFVAAQATEIQSRLVKMTTIMHHLAAWEADYLVFFDRNEELYRSLQGTFDLLTFKVIRAIKNVTKINAAIAEQGGQTDGNVDDWRFLDSLTTQPESFRKFHSVVQTAMGGGLEDLRKDIDIFLDRLLLFVVRGVLTNEKTLIRRRKKLEAMGFTITQQPPSIVPAVVDAIAMAIICSTIWFLAIGSKGTFQDPKIEYIRIILLTLFVLGCNLSLVYYCKRNFAFANSVSSRGKPFGFILTVGLFTALLVIPLRIFFEWIQPGSNMSLSSVINVNLVLSISPWILGTVTALLSEDSMWAGVESPRTKRVLDATVYGAAMAASILILWTLSTRIPIRTLSTMSSSDILRTIAIFSAVYAFIGYRVFARFRDVLSLREPIARNLITQPAFEA